MGYVNCSSPLSDRSLFLPFTTALTGEEGELPVVKDEDFTPFTFSPEKQYDLVIFQGDLFGVRNTLENSPLE